jgi:voltage-gated potassium channel
MIADFKILYKISLLSIWILFCTIISYFFFSNKDNWNSGSTDTHLSLIDLLYFNAVTAFTVGYGDISPKTNTLKIFVIFHMYISYFIVSL